MHRTRLFSAKLAIAVCGYSIAIALPDLAFAGQFKLLHTFAPQSAAGYQPSGELTMDANGALLGTTQFGGTACPSTEYSCGGTVYRLAAPATAGGAWQHSVLYSFKGGRDGSNPTGGIALRPDTGIMFGTTQYGGVPTCPNEPHGWGCGTGFELVPPSAPGGKYSEGIIVPFAGGDKGAFPVPSWLQLKDGRLLGATTSGGTNHGGTIVLLTPKKTPSDGGPNPFIEYFYKYVYSYFQFSNEGSTPFGSFSINITYLPPPPPKGVPYPPIGAIYSTQFDGDETCRCGALSLPRRPDPGDTDWSSTDVFQFRGGANGAFPNYGLVAPDGALYGTARGGLDCPAVTSNGCGIVYKFTPATKTQRATYEVLHRFRGGSDGALPIGRPQVDTNGHVFGVTELGGNGCSSSRGCGVLYELIPPVAPAKAWTTKIQHRFLASPTGGLLLARGAFYGVDNYDVFRFVP